MSQLSCIEVMTEIVNISSRLPAARDQGQRPTCLAFAISDAHAMAAGRYELMSPEYLHFHAAKRSQVGLNAGVGLSKMREALANDGQPLEVECPYSDARDESWRPSRPAGAVWTRESRICTGTPSEILKSALLANRAFVLVVRVSRSFHLPDPVSHTVTEDGRNDGRLHAVLVVGMTTTPIGLVFLARNSWGRDWGADGHAWLPSAYVDTRALSVVAIDPENDE